MSVWLGLQPHLARHLVARPAAGDPEVADHLAAVDHRSGQSVGVPHKKHILDASARPLQADSVQIEGGEGIAEQVSVHRAVLDGTQCSRTGQRLRGRHPSLAGHPALYVRL